MCEFFAKGFGQADGLLSWYGVTKLVPLFQSLNDGEWPLAFRSGGALNLGLLQFSNFFQMAAQVTSIKTVNGGHEVKIDVFKNPTTKIYSGLTATTASGTPIDGTLSVGQKITLLGFFGVNLKKALEGSEGATSEGDAVAVKDAVEFFVFGKAANEAVQTCGGH